MGVIDTRLTALRANYQAPDGSAPPPPVGACHQPVQMAYYLMRRAGDASRPHRLYAVDALFPASLQGRTDTASVDEGTADLLYGLVRGVQPRVVLETGTHKGRSTRAIVAALAANAQQEFVPHVVTWQFDPGHCYTVDAEDHQIIARGAIPAAQAALVTPIIGWTPDVLMREPLASLQGIEFAFLDGDHSAEGLDQELHYVDQHRAPECWVAIDNSRDDGWPGIRRTLGEWTRYPRVSLGTCTGLDLIWMADAVARSPRAETAGG